MANLRSQFEQALTNIEINGQKRKRAIDAHTEIRELLQGDERLKEWGVEPLLIGSYGRETGIYPGKDVDVFLRFTKLDTRAEPRAVFNAVWRVIVRKYGQYGQAAAGHSSRHAASRSCSPTVIAFLEEIFLLMRSPRYVTAISGQSLPKTRTGGLRARAVGSPPAPYFSGTFPRN